MKWLLLITISAMVYCRPQQTQNTPTVEIEKQELIEIHPEGKKLPEDDSKQKKIEDNTKEILEKIAEVNKKHGLTPKVAKPSFLQFPFTYSRSHQDINRDFKFPKNPFVNPILEYVENEANTHRKPLSDEDSGNIDSEEEIPGHYVKRKIVHQQTLLIPNSGTNGFASMVQPIQANIPQYFLRYPQAEASNQFVKSNIDTSEKTTVNDLEKQTIDNIKNIVINSQMPQTSPILFNPYQPLSYQQYNPQMPYNFVNTYFQPKQLTSPLGQYFPIVIKDPFVQMFNAITSMIEYGPMAGGNRPCRRPNPNQNAKPNVKPKDGDLYDSPRDDKSLTTNKLTYEIKNNDSFPEITIFDINNDNPEKTILDIEDLQINNNQMKFNYDLRQSKQNEAIRKTVTLKLDPNQKPSEVQTVHISKEQIRSSTPKNVFSSQIPRESPPNRDQILEDDELEDADKAEDIQVSHDGNKKLFSKDNTGSGIFIHKLKVRKGGVAIAGPGGIATAGSGGTAIVGPNGFAYTKPDSLAIAGSGTKVIAVEPQIDLADIVGDGINKTKLHGTRVGKVVAIGPVIYYNKG